MFRTMALVSQCNCFILFLAIFGKTRELQRAPSGAGWIARVTRMGEKLPLALGFVHSKVRKYHIYIITYYIYMDIDWLVT